MNDHRALAMKLAAVLWSNGICPQCGGKKGTHFNQCTEVYGEMQPYSRDIEKPFVEAFESDEGSKR